MFRPTNTRQVDLDSAAKWMADIDLTLMVYTAAQRPEELGWILFKCQCEDFNLKYICLLLPFYKLKKIKIVKWAQVQFHKYSKRVK